MSSGRVYVEDGEVVLCTGTDDGEGNEWATAMDPDAAEEMAHALLLGAHAARGRSVGESEKALVGTWKLSVERSRLRTEPIERARDIARTIMSLTKCPDPGEGGCIGGPIPGVGCIHEGARVIASSMDNVLRSETVYIGPFVKSCVNR